MKESILKTAALAIAWLPGGYLIANGLVFASSATRDHPLLSLLLLTICIISIPAWSIAVAYCGPIVLAKLGVQIKRRAMTRMEQGEKQVGLNVDVSLEPYRIGLILSQRRASRLFLHFLAPNRTGEVSNLSFLMKRNLFCQDYNDVTRKIYGDAELLKIDEVWQQDFIHVDYDRDIISRVYQSCIPSKVNRQNTFQSAIAGKLAEAAGALK